MYACNSQSFVLEHFLRMDTFRPESWLSALQVLTNSPRLSQKILTPTDSRSFRGRLSFLPSDNLNVCGFYMRHSSMISGANAGSAAIVMPVEGTVDFKVTDEHRLCGPWAPFVLDPHEEFHATLSDETHLFIVQLPCLREGRYRHAFLSHQSRLVEGLTNFLYETPFFRDYKHAQRRVERFSRRLYDCLETGSLPCSGPPERKNVNDDGRLCKAIQLLNHALDKDIDIKAVASRSGLSLRNFHYLMKQYTGQSPYQYVRGRRLIKAREAIIQDYPDRISVSQQAFNWRFQHAGRFSSYYRQHFGEYPTQTLRELDHLKQLTHHVRSAGDNFREIRQYWLTSSASPMQHSLRSHSRMDEQEA
ncbi:MAG: Transcriptional regulator containing an amidase domain and an AraC-type DNA-binding HTH domain [Marinobacter sp. HL-58]|nr:MAG: Transcriptional regulator containing an amidase domain and an AraC-type DNA-binding HTH domain [Marinobacter sp. HL-58]